MQLGRETSWKGFKPSTGYHALGKKTLYRADPASKPLYLPGTRTQEDRLQGRGEGACLCPGTQCRRSELVASTQACNSKLNKLLG